MSSVSAIELWRRGRIGWPRRFPIAQFPNSPLLFAIAGWAIAAASKGAVHDVARVVFTLGLVVWAAQEVLSGTNWFRRVLGVAALVWIVVRLATHV